MLELELWIGLNLGFGFRVLGCAVEVEADEAERLEARVQMREGASAARHGGKPVIEPSRRCLGCLGCLGSPDSQEPEGRGSPTLGWLGTCWVDCCGDGPAPSPLLPACAGLPFAEVRPPPLGWGAAPVPPLCRGLPLDPLTPPTTTASMPAAFPAFSCLSGLSDFDALPNLTLCRWLTLAQRVHRAARAAPHLHWCS